MSNLLSKQLRNKFFLHSREIVENTVNCRYCGHMTRAISRLILQLLSKARSQYTLSNCPGKLLERVRTQIKGILGHTVVHAVPWGIPHSPLASNKHLLLTNDTANLESLLNQY